MTSTTSPRARPSIKLLMLQEWRQKCEKTAMLSWRHLSLFRLQGGGAASHEGLNTEVRVGESR